MNTKIYVKYGDIRFKARKANHKKYRVKYGTGPITFKTRISVIN